jgi:hypothetical protein
VSGMAERDWNGVFRGGVEQAVSWAHVRSFAMMMDLWNIAPPFPSHTSSPFPPSII